MPPDFQDRIFAAGRLTSAHSINNRQSACGMMNRYDAVSPSVASDNENPLEKTAAKTLHLSRVCSRRRIASMRYGNRLLFGVWLLVCASFIEETQEVAADVKLPGVFGNSMLLQQESDVLLWGWAAAGEKIEVSADWLQTEIAVVAGDDGKWNAKVKTPVAGGPYDVTVAGTNSITLHDVMIGEVWLCSGQSNMAWPVHLADKAQDEIAAACFPDIRLFQMKRTIATLPANDCDGRWVKCSPETVASFSAVAYFYGRELHRELGVPVGLIDSSWGGTVAEAWTSSEGLAREGGFEDALSILAAERRQPGALKERHARRLEEYWTAVREIDPGSGDPGWEKPEYDDSHWKVAHVPGAWHYDRLDSYDGIIWFRRHVDVPQEWLGQDLRVELGPIDDIDTTYFNGVKLGDPEHTRDWLTRREYRLPAHVVRAGTNVLAIRILDNIAEGGIYGNEKDLRVYQDNDGSAAPLSLAGLWRYHLGAAKESLPDWPGTGELHANWPTVLYNGMIAPIVGYSIAGVIWYQGESNRSQAAKYRTLFPTLIGDWREKWSIGEFPFYYVQIAPFKYSGDKGETALLRETQAGALSLRNTGMVVTTDIGNINDIHPRDKQTVGRRLALWALAKTYGRRETICSGPMFSKMEIEDDRIRVHFSHVGGGLRSRDSAPLSWFELAGETGHYVPAKAIIEGHTVVVYSVEVPKPVAVRFAWADVAEPNLMNAEGLPAVPFRTDLWDGQ